MALTRIHPGFFFFFFTLFGRYDVVGGRGGIGGDFTYVDKPFWYQ